MAVVSSASERLPHGPKVTVKWREAEWGPAERRRLARLLFGRLHEREAESRVRKAS
jgi:hypothetical protein